MLTLFTIGTRIHDADRVRILVTNRLGEGTAVHWHGLILPSGMDGVQGVSQRSILPGDTFKYEFTLKQHGTQMCHSHGDEQDRCDVLVSDARGRRAERPR